MRLLCDGSYEGLLTALFYATALRPKPDEILLNMPPQGDMFEPPMPIETEPDKAARVQFAIETKLSPDTPENVRFLYASALDNAGTLALRYLSFGWEVGQELDNYMTHPCVEPVLKIVRRVEYERHHILGMLRFNKLENGVFYAPIEPDYDIIPLMIDHFADRLHDQPFIIHDIRHATIALHKPGNDASSGSVLVTHASHAKLSIPDDEYADIWRAFYKAIGVEGRKNLKLRNSFMRPRYHKYLTELT